LEAELRVGFGEGAWDGVAKDDVLREVFDEFAVEGLQGEFGATFVGRSCEEKGEVGEGRVLELLSDVEFLGDEAIEVMVTGKLDGG
jgi:hypothetical protein